MASYRVYYRPTPTGAFTLLGTTAAGPATRTGTWRFRAGCYAVQAVAASGLASDTSNVACQDNCVFFKLPNIFTPTGDGVNDVFRPKNNSPMRRIHFQAFNRWGVKVFENTTTTADRVLINWDGGGPTGESGSGRRRRVSDGMYYYLAEVEFADFANTKRTYKGWVEISALSDQQASLLTEEKAAPRRPVAFVWLICWALRAFVQLAAPVCVLQRAVRCMRSVANSHPHYPP